MNEETRTDCSDTNRAEGEYDVEREYDYPAIKRTLKKLTFYFLFPWFVLLAGVAICIFTFPFLFSGSLNCEDDPGSVMMLFVFFLIFLWSVLLGICGDKYDAMREHLGSLIRPTDEPQIEPYNFVETARKRLKEHKKRQDISADLKSGEVQETTRPKIE